ncbi:alanine racemase [Loktanella fryxellensis]|uniref:Alanine racemase n=1 Tax=Loktanella fryxellensis TaxID=245187 RepID=A0A1H7YX43_9RHOB|nr:alanine racemase [Loktanella fryxellensis]SEM49847.1 alanine racemase [Loktanella fryxellensis]
MSTGHLTIDLAALAHNWRSLNALTACDTAAVIKADAYGLGAGRVAKTLAKQGVRTFYIAMVEEAAAIREAIGDTAQIRVLSGHMRGDTDTIAALHLTPILNSVDQIQRHFEALPDAPFGLQLDTGMNRLGLEWDDWAAVAEAALRRKPVVVMSHLACADEPDHPMNPYQLDIFHQMTDGITTPRSLAATGGILLGPAYHFDECRAGIGLYGGHPFVDARPVVRLDLPVIQIRDLTAGEVVGYGNAWQADRPTRLATVAAGYADGLHRALARGLHLWHGHTPCPVVGRISMDAITVDVTDLPEDPASLAIICEDQPVDRLAQVAGTIGYEMLTSLGTRYSRRYAG